MSSLLALMIPNCFCLIASSDGVLTIFSVANFIFKQIKRNSLVILIRNLSPSYFPTDPSSATQSCTK